MLCLLDPYLLCNFNMQLPIWGWVYGFICHHASHTFHKVTTISFWTATTKPYDTVIAAFIIHKGSQSLSSVAFCGILYLPQTNMLWFSLGNIHASGYTHIPLDPFWHIVKYDGSGRHSAAGPGAKAEVPCEVTPALLKGHSLQYCLLGDRWHKTEQCIYYLLFSIKSY